MLELHTAQLLAEAQQCKQAMYVWEHLVEILACPFQNFSVGALEEIARALKAFIRSVESLLFDGVLAHFNAFERFQNLNMT